MFKICLSQFTKIIFLKKILAKIFAKTQDNVLINKQFLLCLDTVCLLKRKVLKHNEQIKIFFAFAY